MTAHSRDLGAIEALTNEHIGWRSKNDKAMYEAEYDLGSDIFYAVGLDSSINPIRAKAYEVSRNGATISDISLNGFNSRDLVFDYGSNEWHASLQLSRGAPYQGTWSLINREKKSATNLAAFNTQIIGSEAVYNITDGFYTSRGIIDIYSKDNGDREFQVIVRKDGQEISTSYLGKSGSPKVSIHAATWDPGSYTIYAIAWPEERLRTNFELYSLSIDPMSWIYGKWQKIDSFNSPSIAKPENGTQWTEAFINALRFDIHTNELIYCGNIHSYANNSTISNGFIGTHSLTTDKQDLVSVTLSHAPDAHGNWANAISDIEVLNDKYLIAGGHRTVSEIHKQEEFDQTLYLVNRNDWSIEARSINTQQYDSVNTISLDKYGGILIGGSGFTYIDSISSAFDVNLDLDVKQGAIVVPDENTLLILEGKERPSKSRYFHERGSETYGKQDIYILPAKQNPYFFSGEPYWYSMDLGRIDPLDIILIDSRVDHNYIGQINDCIWYDPNYQGKPYALGEWGFANHPESYELAFYAVNGHIPFPSQFGRLDFSQVDFSEIRGFSTQEFLNKYSTAITGIDTGLLFRNGPPPNSQPVLSGLKASLKNGLEDNNYQILQKDLLKGWFDADGDDLTVQNLVSSKGSLIDSGFGEWTLTPPPNSSGQVILSYEVVDGQGASSQAELAFNIEPVNDIPVLSGLKASLKNGLEDNNYQILQKDLLKGWFDADGDELLVQNLITSKGSLIDSGFGEWTLTPPLNSNGQITLSYEISDGKGADISTEILLTFDPVNDSPQLTSEAGILPNGLSNFPYEINRGYLSQGWEDPDGDDFNVFIRSVSVGKLFNNILILPSNYIGPVEIRYEVLDYTRANNPVSLSFDILENNATVAPTDILLSRTHVDENTFPNQEIAEIFTQDADIGETFKYTLIPTIDSNLFSIATNKLFLHESPNYEAKEKYFLRIRTTDRGGAGLSYEKDITINVIDINEEPSDFSIVSHFISVPENISWRESPALADLLITDDYINNCSIELVGDDADYFILKGNQLFLSSKALDYEEKTKLDLTISVQDFSIEGSKALTSNYSLNIDDVAENELVHRLRNPATGRFLFSSNKYEIDLLHTDT